MGGAAAFEAADLDQSSWRELETGEGVAAVGAASGGLVRAGELLRGVQATTEGIGAAETTVGIQAIGDGMSVGSIGGGNIDLGPGDVTTT